jgi:folate-binding protein YgfZ
MTVSAAVHALEGGSTSVFADLSNWLKFEVSGPDARNWLNDLVTNRVDDIGHQQSRRSLFLDRTGRIQADFHVLGMRDGSLLLVQDPHQPDTIVGLLDRYVLSSEVTLEARTLDFALVSTPNTGEAVVALEGWWPSVLGSGLDRLVPAEDRQRERAAHGDGWIEATEQDLEVWRIRQGRPRFGVDFGEEWLPSEAGAGFEDLIDTTKGCFLGQESVAKVRNLGHPPRLVLPFEAPDRVYPMAQITADGEPVGRVTSVAPLDAEPGTACIGWIRWEARDAELAVDGSFSLSPRREPTRAAFEPE